jgi:hypothetical protein
LDASEGKLGQQLQGQDVVIAAISIPATMRQISLANAVKVTGVKRFVPCFFAPVATPEGLVDLRGKVGNLPYTIIDVGWWFQFSLPMLTVAWIYAFLETATCDQHLLTIATLENSSLALSLTLGLCHSDHLRIHEDLLIQRSMVF